MMAIMIGILVVVVVCTGAYMPLYALALLVVFPIEVLAKITRHLMRGLAQ